MKTISRYRLSQSEFVKDLENILCYVKVFKKTRGIIDSYYAVDGIMYESKFNHVDLLAQWNYNKITEVNIPVYNMVVKGDILTSWVTDCTELTVKGEINETDNN